MRASCNRNICAVSNDLLNYVIHLPKSFQRRLIITGFRSLRALET